MLIKPRISQVKAKCYHVPYQGKGRPIHAIGLSFSSKTHNLEEAKVETLEE